MKIISTPDTSNWAYKYTCTGCDAVLEAGGKDLRYTVSPHYDDDDTYRVQCPICAATKFIPEKDIPKMVRVEAQRRANAKGSIFDQDELNR